MHDHDGEMPPQIAAFMEMQREAADQQMAAQEAMRHEVQHFFDELSISQLVTLRMLLDGMSPEAAAFYEGVCATMLHVKHNVCTACGEDHTEELLTMAVEETDDGQG